MGSGNTPASGYRSTSDPKTKRSGLRPAIEVSMPEETAFATATKLADGLLTRAKFAADPRPEFRKVGQGYIGICPAVFAFAESRVHMTFNRRNVGRWNSIMAHHDPETNAKVIDSWLERAFAIRSPEVLCDTPAGLIPEILRDRRGTLIVALLDVTGRDDTEILKPSTLAGSVTLKIRGRTLRESFRILSPGAELAPAVAFERKDGWDRYTFPVDKFPVYSQIMVKYE